MNEDKLILRKHKIIAPPSVFWLESSQASLFAQATAQLNTASRVSTYPFPFQVNSIRTVACKEQTVLLQVIGFLPRGN